ncbi:MAG: hypothetical protein A2Y57_04180 [Candidatus Woykebacteria bacterium RBG_13_40_7b]|uniref:Uncharacterized protein n=1 Tax=Candidatus Woykebacteria bacterium RBG_13_40_7b TaxID=1802594 RepID=A0A1G1W994_9BACT|nr:MAG: hypothetical protein A2Y57_04180 [Candidatus Woykebacteria bacterium RBG_13_40_7b]
MRDSWIKLYRKLVNNDLIRDATCLQIFVWILLNVDRQTGKMTLGRKWASNFFNIPDTTFYGALKRLEKKYEIIDLKTIKTTIKYTEVTVKKWRFYQYEDKDTDNQPTINRQSTDTLQEYKNKRNKEKESNKEKVLAILENPEIISEKARVFGLRLDAVRLEIQKCADWWGESRKELKKPQAAVNNWLSRVKPYSKPTEQQDEDFLQKRIKQENQITEQVKEISPEQREKNLTRLAEIKDKLESMRMEAHGKQS